MCGFIMRTIKNTVAMPVYFRGGACIVHGSLGFVLSICFVVLVYVSLLRIVLNGVRGYVSLFGLYVGTHFPLHLYFVTP